MFSKKQFWRKSIVLLLVFTFSLMFLGTPALAEDFTGYPMEHEDVTLEFYFNHGPVLNSNYGSYEESPFHTGLSEMTGVNIEWKFPTAGTDPAQDFNLLLASASLPDVIFGPVVQEAEQYLDEGVILDISDYIEEHAPNYYEWITEDEIRNKAMKSDSGKYIGFGFFREDGGWNDTYLGPVIRKDWLDEQDLEIPETIDDLDHVIRVFNDAYDAKFSFSWDSRFNNIGLAGAFGAHGGIVFQMYVDDGEVKLAQIEPEWLDYMAKLNEWYEDDLIDQDVFTLDDTLTQTKALNEAMGVSYTSMGQLSNWVRDAEKAENGAEWIGIAYPTDEDGNLASVFGGYGIDPNNVTFLTSDIDEDKIPIALRVLDYAYTDEGSLFWNYGKQGVSWDYDENNEVQFLPLVTEDPDGQNDAVTKYAGAVWNGPCIQLTHFLHLKNTEVSIEANDIWYYSNVEQTYEDKLPPGFSFTLDEAREVTNIQTPIETYISECSSQFVTGEKSLDEFDEFVQNIYDMDVERLTEIYQAAYDRFMER